MKNRLQNLLQDRKTLYLVLCVAVISVFTLSIAYAAMSTVLEIHGYSEVVASSWDIHLDNVEVKSGSVSANAPVISGNSTLAFEVELNTPGEFYEFTVDVVNEGSIDAMIDSVVKTPELTSAQAKYIKYEISYENGEVQKVQPLHKCNFDVLSTFFIIFSIYINFINKTSPKYAFIFFIQSFIHWFPVSF